MKDSLSELHPSRIVARRMHELESELQRARMHVRRYNKSPDTTGRWSLEQPTPPAQEEGWFITYLDMMTLLLVVMIVMLAFSGTLNDGIGPSLSTPSVIAPTGSADVIPEDSTAVAANSEAAPIATDSPEPSPPSVEPATVPAPAAPLSDTGLLPGGSGLLPGSTGLAEGASAGHAQPGLTLAAPPAHPADIGPLPRDAMISAGMIPPQPPVRAMSELYPGWSATDLSASFVGPRRPAPAPVPTPEAAAQPPVEDAPSEGEALAAGLALGDLGGDVEIIVSERSVSFRVNNEILFDSSQADLSRSGLSVLRNIVNVLASTGHDITVEGHTDAVPVRRNIRYPSNWELSSARAGSVVRYLQANGIDRSRLRAVGYADTRPIGDNHTPAGRAANRRVELVIEKHPQPADINPGSSD